MISQHIQRFLEENEPVDAADLPDDHAGMPKWRKRFEEQMVAVCRPAPDITTSVAEIGGVSGVWFEPPRARPDAPLLYLHGGGLITSSPRAHAGMIGEVARAAGRRTFAPDYRLAPEHPFPAQRDDVLNAYRGLLESGFDGHRIAVFGDSAGGGLALVLAMVARDLDLPAPLGVATLSAWTDLAHTSESCRTVADAVCTLAMLKKMAQWAAGRADLTDSRLSPLYGDFANLPPLLILAGELEALRDDSVRVANRARDAGVDVTLRLFPGLPHIWPWFVPEAPESVDAYRAVAGFFTDLESRHQDCNSA